MRTANDRREEKYNILMLIFNLFFRFIRRKVIVDAYKKSKNVSESETFKHLKCKQFNRS